MNANLQVDIRQFKIGNMQNPNYGNNLLKSSHCWFELLIDAATIMSLSIFYEYYNDIET